ncbi:MAG: hypothetical protein LBF88_05095 [Planctomycetaceae bacterium]|jgi:hypothetical protein|nr:hypothetical protein [Planctomycetaceae bacterium]
MRISITFFLISVLCSVFTGCLSIGGKSIHCEHKIDESRFLRVEQRLDTLEQLTGVNSAVPPVVPIIGQPN